jgi:hypothetical protein
MRIEGEAVMGRRVGADGFSGQHAWLSQQPEITLYAANVGVARAEASVLRQRLQAPVSLRTWHRVFPYLPTEALPDGSLVLWHPDESGWLLAQERVHQLAVPAWRRSGAYVSPPGSERLVLRDFHELDDIDLPDWSMAVPDACFAGLVARTRGAAWRLSELVARWALEVGPVRAGHTLALQYEHAGAQRH